MSLFIMIIDDDPLVGMVVQDRLAGIDCDIKLHSDSLTALEAVKREKPNLILLDICMPGVDGLTLCRQLKGDSETRDIRIVAISGSTRASDHQSILAHGAEAFIPKPLDDNFSQRITELLSRSRRPSP
ncbi:MAG: response regulator [Elusimicrobiota bacterium]